MKAIGFNVGQRGDLILNTVAARAFRERFSETDHLTLGVAPQYADMLPLFAQHPDIDTTHVYGCYEGWPNAQDQAYLKWANYGYVFNGMPQHRQDDWWRIRHQAAETCVMHGLAAPANLQCQLNPWFAPYLDDLHDYVALNWIGGFQDWPNRKSFSLERATEVVRLIRAMGYKVLVLGDPREPALPDTERRNLTYFESVKAMLACRAFVGVDSGLMWVASAYSHRALGLYANGYYGAEFVKHIQPVNPNAIYLDAPVTNEIALDRVAQCLHDLVA